MKNEIISYFDVVGIEILKMKNNMKYMYMYIKTIMK